MLFNYDGGFSQKFENTIQDYLRSSVLEKMKIVNFDGFLLVLEKQWNDFKNLMSRKNTVLSYYGDSCKESSTNVVTNICLRNFRDTIVRNHQVKRQLRSSLFKLVAGQRNNNFTDVNSLKLARKACEMLTELSSDNANNVYESIS